MRALWQLALAGLIVSVGTSLAVAQQHEEKKPPAGGSGQPADVTKPETPGEPAMDPAMQAMMDAWAKLALPGEHHGHLKPLVGSWTVVGRWHMDPAAPWSEFKSVATIEEILGGRFVMQKAKGDAMMPNEPPFEGLGIIGYDNQKQKYDSVWMDNMGTMMMTGEGTCSADGKEITFKSTFTDAMTSQPTWMKTVYKIKGPTGFVLEMHGPTQDGKEFMSMELTYTKK